MLVEREGEEDRKKEGVTDRLKLGTFVAARHFSHQPADMTAKAVRGAWWALRTRVGMSTE